MNYPEGVCIVCRRYSREKEIFESFGLEIPFEPLEFRGEIAYRGPYGKYYNLIDYGSYIRLRIQEEASEKIDERLYIYRIGPEEDVEEVIKEIIRKLQEKGEEVFHPSFLYGILSSFVRRCVKKELTEENIKNLCELYDVAVRAGGYGYLVSDSCREMLQMYTMKQNPMVDPELHERMIRVPDMFYDFLFSTENNLAGDPERQERVKNFLKKYQVEKAEDLIVYTSYLDSNPNDSDRNILRYVKLFHESKSFKGDHMKLRKDEILGDDGKYHGFRITSLVVDGVGYRIRHNHSTIFMDYMNHCIGSTALLDMDEETAQLVRFQFSDRITYSGCQDRLLDFTERIAASEGKKYLVINCPPDRMEYFMDKGYTIENPMEYVFYIGCAVKKKLV